ncbi:MAG: helix-turn-helix domain-containing protein [Oscillospiraceae bacterium]|nr:helix-turn-helix domain-containing protein [Oscillospiraceae bacterium]
MKDRTWNKMPLILTTKDLTILMNVREATIRRWARDGRLPAKKIGKQYLFDREAIMHRLKGVEED